MAEIHTERNPHLAHHFEDLEQQQEAVTLGMWLFLATEIMLFGGLFLVFQVYRIGYPEAFVAAAEHLQFLVAGVNTAVLLCSSFTIALAVHAAQTGNSRRAALFLLATIVLGSIFLGIKGYEWYHEYEEALVPGLRFIWEGAPEHAGPAYIFFSLYFTMTGLHATHMIIGMVLLAAIAFMAWRNKFSAEYYAPVELIGLYWHFIDVVWVFLYPVLYLLI
ncbi:MAG: cytochrome c oxidase subunit 3 family protein [Chloroflexota bacterium]|nr:cytochrome c oxidase subunit 3 family protein [Chloroflexota bacterium]